MARPQTWIVPAAIVFAVVAAGGTILRGQQAPSVGAQGAPPAAEEGFRFHSGVELINVNATVTDSRGRFVSSLQPDDFTIYEDGQPQTISHFSNERVPVSLGILLDTSGSMAGEKMSSARDAVDRFLSALLSPADEIFLYRFGSEPELVQEWTRDRQRLSRALGRISANGGTALLDAVAEALPVARTGQNRKKAILIISDGNDTNSSVSLREVKDLIRESDVLVYAIGIDGRGQPALGSGGPPRIPIPIPIPIPGGGRRGPWRFPPIGGGRQVPPAASGSWTGDDGVNGAALRDITDDSGGRTEIIRSSRDLDPATANIADELSKQYYLGYSSSLQNDGRWHTIRVEVRDRSLRVRGRRGYMATP